MNDGARTFARMMTLIKMFHGKPDMGDKIQVYLSKVRYGYSTFII